MRWLLLMLASLLSAQTRQIALTIDDAPRGGDLAQERTLPATLALTRQLITALRPHPATIFANPIQARDLTEEGLLEILRLWHLSGFELGNHTFSHPDLNKVPLAEYQADILRAEPALRRARSGTPSRFFRHTFLHTGATAEVRDGLNAFLAEQNLTPAPVTIDTSDWLFARVYTTTTDASAFRRRYLDFIDAQISYAEHAALTLFSKPIPHVLLLHANQLNADALPDLLTLLSRRGYSVISLAEALKDPAYQSADTHPTPHGLTWLRRWAKSRGISLPPEPNEPADILSAYEKQR